MDLQGKRLLDVLGKPLSLAEKIVLNWGQGRTLGHQNESGDHLHRPSPATNSMMTSNPLIPTFLLVIAVILMIYNSPIRVWLTDANDLPNLMQIFALAHKRPSTALPKAGEDVSVWAKKQSGYYYCQGGALFGNKPGEIMTQADALSSGYRPADGHYCAIDDSGIASADNLSLRFQQWLASVSSDPNLGDLSTLFAKKQPAEMQAGERVGVWTKKQSGYYYCQGGTLYGNKPGEIMTQADALMSGYRPAGGHYCLSGKTNEASVGTMPLQTPIGVK